MIANIQVNKLGKVFEYKVYNDDKPLFGGNEQGKITLKRFLELNQGIVEAYNMNDGQKIL